MESNPDEVRHAINRIKQDHDESRLIIGPGCSIPPETPMENLQAIRELL
jgi:uroporphyrinogen-III decarboxylase